MNSTESPKAQNVSFIVVSLSFLDPCQQLLRSLMPNFHVSIPTNNYVTTFSLENKPFSEKTEPPIAVTERGVFGLC